MISFSALASAPSVPLSFTLRDVKWYFFDRQFYLDEVSGMVMAIAALVFLLICGLVYTAVKNRRKPYVPQDWITNAKDIYDTIQTAFDQRAHFALHFNPGKSAKRPALQCVGDRIDHNYMILEVLGLKSLSKRWVGREFEGFFQLLEKGQPRYLAFFGVIENIFAQDTCCFLRTLLPYKLETRQKRSYLRIVPPEEYMLGAAIWCGDAFPTPDQRLRIASWQKPTLVLLPAVLHQFSIRDISAGGMRVHIDAGQIPVDHTVFNANREIMLMLDLWDPDKQQRLRCWMESRVQNPVVDIKSGGLNLGIQFRSWARPKDDEGDNDLEWLRLSSSGEIESLGNWIMRRHLEFFREPDTPQE